MKSITINISNTDNVKRPNPIIIKRWLIDNFGVYCNNGSNNFGSEWNIDRWNDGKELFWTITFKDDETAIEFALRFL